MKTVLFVCRFVKAEACCGKFCSFSVSSCGQTWLAVLSSVFARLPGLSTSHNSQTVVTQLVSLSVSGRSECPDNLPLSAVCSVLNCILGFLKQMPSAWCLFLFLGPLLVQIVWEWFCQRSRGPCQASSWDSWQHRALADAGFFPGVELETNWQVLNLLKGEN